MTAFDTVRTSFASIFKWFQDQNHWMIIAYTLCTTQSASQQQRDAYNLSWNDDERVSSSSSSGISVNQIRIFEIDRKCVNAQ